jgi:glucosyl-3-phosphoglycerate synthase
VEIGLLTDTLEAVGLRGMAQVDLGERRHRHHDDQRLGRMASEIWQTVLARLHRDTPPHPLEPTLTQFERRDDRYVAVTHEITALERPPMARVRGDERTWGR